MNDTQLNPRQIKILEYLAANPARSREQITAQALGQDASRITVIRDLNDLINQDWIEQLGGGKYVTYAITDARRTLVPTNLDEYFSQQTDQRLVAHKKFNPELIANLINLLTNEEKALFETGKKTFAAKREDLDQPITKRELERFAIELSWKSSRIEGNTYSLLETEDLIKNQRPAPGHNRSEAIMILNHKHAFDTTLAKPDMFQKISTADIRSLHAVLVKDLSIPSNIREAPVGITGTTYSPLDNKWQIEEALESVVTHTANTTSIPEQALVWLAMISYLQPFADGNKRTARMLSNALLIANDYFPLSYRSVDEVEYKKALILFYEQNNIFHLKRIFLEQQQFAIDHYFR